VLENALSSAASEEVSFIPTAMQDERLGHEIALNVWPGERVRAVDHASAE